ALGLVPLLSAFGAEEVVTSPWARCRDTVAPYAEAAGLDLVLAPQLTEDGAEADPRSARALVLETLRTRSPGAALCLHRPTLPLVLDAVSARSVHRVRDVLPETDPWLAKGELLVLHLATPGKRKARVVAAALHRTCTPLDGPVAPPSPARHRARDTDHDGVPPPFTWRSPGRGSAVTSRT